MQQRPVYIHIQDWEQSKKYSAPKELNITANYVAKAILHSNIF